MMVVYTSSRAAFTIKRYFPKVDDIVASMMPDEFLLQPLIKKEQQYATPKTFSSVELDSRY
jgi:hypothetical protein